MNSSPQFVCPLFVSIIMIHFPSVVFLFTQFWHTEVSSLNSNADNKIVDNDINVNVTSPPLSAHLHHPEQYNHKDLF